MGDMTSLILFSGGGLLIYAVIVLPIMAIILRGAVGLTNRALGPRKPTASTFEERSSDTVPDPDNPFAAPRVQAVIQEVSSTLALPAPKVGWAVVISLVSLIAHTAVRFIAVLLTIQVVGPFGNEVLMLGIQGFLLGLIFLVSVSYTHLTLPTKA